MESTVSWQYVASAASDVPLSRTSRAIRIGGAGDLYAYVGSTLVETQVAASLAIGEIVYIKTDTIGASTTCTKMTVYHD